MVNKIKITLGNVEVTAELNKSKTAEATWNSLPIKSSVSLWGDEIYFSIPLHLKLEDGKEIVNIGDLGYWPDGPAFCIFFGPTPVSRGSEIRPASAVSVFGKVLGDTSILKQVRSGSRVIIDKVAGH